MPLVMLVGAPDWMLEKQLMDNCLLLVVLALEQLAQVLAWRPEMLECSSLVL